jgi:hypothetical protein
MADGARRARRNENYKKDESALNDLLTAFNQLQAVDTEYCMYCGSILAESDSKCLKCGY